jgi:hypothetical protein
MRPIFTTAAAAFLVAGVLSAIPASAASLTSKDFLGWDDKRKAFYVRTSMIAAQMITARNNESRGKCLMAWYFKEPAKAHTMIFSEMKKKGDVHPTAVILGTAAKACGGFKF